MINAVESLPNKFDEHEIKDINYCLVYNEFFNHRMPGANRVKLIAKLASMVGIELDDEIRQAFEKSNGLMG